MTGPLPLLHLPLYLGIEHLPPRLDATLLGAVQGLNLVTDRQHWRGGKAT